MLTDFGWYDFFSVIYNYDSNSLKTKGGFPFGLTEYAEVGIHV